MYVKPAGMVIGVVGAFALGMVTGVLVAPWSGARTRSRLSLAAREVGDRAATAREKAAEVVDRLRAKQA
jgi:hypothetical protein